MKTKRDCLERCLCGQIVETMRKQGEMRKEKGRKVIGVGVTMTYPSGEDAHTTDRRTLQAIALDDSPSYVRIR